MRKPAPTRACYLQIAIARITQTHSEMKGEGVFKSDLPIAF